MRTVLAVILLVCAVSNAVFGILDKDAVRFLVGIGLVFVSTYFIKEG